jgi:hypothetical protein
MPEVKSTYVGELRIEVTGTCPPGASPLGQRRLERLDRGHFKGPKIQAEIMAGGMDLLPGGTDGALTITAAGWQGATPQKNMHPARRHIGSKIQALSRGARRRVHKKDVLRGRLAARPAASARRRPSAATL